MARTAVRRVNEWDGPSMLKVYTPYTGTPAAPEREAPDLQAYVRRIDRYTYGLGWLLCEIDHQTVGFCHLSEDPAAPEDYDAFFEAISAPVEAHTVTLPYGQGGPALPARDA